MIGRLRGRIVEKQPPRLVIDVGGVGYELAAPMSTFAALAEPGGQATLLTQMIVRDDALVLYGFASADERRLFRELIKISGVGAKLALSVLSGMSVADFVATIATDDSTRLTGLPGVGKKTAARLLVEMRDKLSDSELAPALAPASDSDGVKADARQALVALGYKPTEAARLLSGIDAHALDSEGVIREALRRAVR